MNRKRVLVVEDEPNIRDTLRFNLTREGYTVVEAATGGEALRVAQASPPDLILLDLMLPEMSGFEVCRILRQTTAVPIIMLTAKDQEADKVLGLGLGADDYISKPFSLQELFARMTAVLRRSASWTPPGKQDQASVQEAGPLILNHDARQVTMNGEELHLSRKEFDLLAFLLAHPGKVFSREQLIQNVWDYNFVGDRKTVDVHIRWLRQKLGEVVPLTITTVRGVGYRLDFRAAEPAMRLAKA
ncbi:MAG: response regulator transcription factor [Candidatus Dormibacteria bacterium]